MSIRSSSAKDAEASTVLHHKTSAIIFATHIHWSIMGWLMACLNNQPTMRTLKFECQSLASEAKRPPLWVMVPLMHGLLQWFKFCFNQRNLTIQQPCLFWMESQFLLYNRFTVPKCHQALTQKCLTMQIALCTKVTAKVESSFWWHLVSVSSS